MIITALLISYLLGSIPFGLLLTRAAGLGDIRAIGSGNIGATNVMRTGNKKLGIATLLLDALKGALPVIIARQFDIPQDALYLIAFAAVIGHVFPVWLKFKGGKGVATAFGVLFGLAPGIGIIAGLIWLIEFKITKFVSVSSIGAFWLVSLVPIFLSNANGFYFCLALALLITWTHRENIKRLKANTEPRYEKKP
ncbi:MAG: glycerol-3-phosphate 1-O-acyltransferase PlsY [Alphaproteobacteria bacterium]|nr:glycerol-3-phosphate 1-O-acyltransferase PlsY [Alphaproteobacteria bacterium]